MIVHILQGVIFSINYHQQHRQICSVSDDRSIRLWQIARAPSASDNDECSLFEWEKVAFKPLHILYGHLARVWDVRLLDKYIISVGEVRQKFFFSLIFRCLNLHHFPLVMTSVPSNGVLLFCIYIKILTSIQWSASYVIKSNRLLLWPPLLQEWSLVWGTVILQWWDQVVDCTRWGWGETKKCQILLFEMKTISHSLDLNCYISLAGCHNMCLGCSNWQCGRKVQRSQREKHLEHGC